MYKLVIFDFDGTLADSARWVARELNPLGARFGFRQVSEAEIESLRGCDARQILARLGVPSWKLPLSPATFAGARPRTPRPSSSSRGPRRCCAAWRARAWCWAW